MIIIIIQKYEISPYINNKNKKTIVFFVKEGKSTIFAYINKHSFPITK